MRPITIATLLAALVFGGLSDVFAQSVEIYTDKSYDYEEFDESTPWVYRYRSDRPIVRPANCGEFRYWDGERCVDARDVPPDLR